ncbi:hypothetical protein EB001_23975 [bacterium]|nr:hypothetical protein [bacterium]
MPFIGNKPSAVPLTSADITDSIITSAKIVDGTIANADINSSAAIALSKLSTTGTASSSNYLRGDGAWTAVSSDYVLLATTDASASSSVSFDGYYSSTYKNYKVIISDFIPATNNIGFWIRYNQSGSPLTASYQYITSVTYSTVATPDYVASAIGSQSDTKINLISSNSQTNTAGFCLSVEVTIFNPLNTANYKRIHIVGSGMEGNNTYHWLGHTAGLYKGNTSALSGITFLCSSGNITSGNFKLYGIK